MSKEPDEIFDIAKLVVVAEVVVALIAVRLVMEEEAAMSPVEKVITVEVELLGNGQS